VVAVSGFLTVAQVADELGFSPRTILRWIAAGNLQAVRLPGGRLRISQTAWSAFLAERSTGTRGVTLACVDEGGK
jgi:excisionase family DNA binding protein